MHGPQHREVSPQWICCSNWRNYLFPPTDATNLSTEGNLEMHHLLDPASYFEGAFLSSSIWDISYNTDAFETWEAIFFINFLQGCDFLSCQSSHRSSSVSVLRSIWVLQSCVQPVQMTLTWVFIVRVGALLFSAQQHVRSSDQTCKYNLSSVQKLRRVAADLEITVIC